VPSPARRGRPASTPAAAGGGGGGGGTPASGGGGGRTGLGDTPSRRRLSVADALSDAAHDGDALAAAAGRRPPPRPVGRTDVVGGSGPRGGAPPSGRPRRSPARPPRGVKADAAAGRVGPTAVVGGPPADRPDLPYLTEPDYYTRPSMEELAAAPAADLASVTGFTVGRTGVGEVTWTTAVDVRGLDVNGTIELQPRQVSMDADAVAASALNAPATVRLVGVWRRDKATGAPRRGAAADAAMRKKLRAHCEAAGLTWGGYDGEGGVWQFQVEHFL